jgi:predicted AAA+ superfamily ATPase
MLQSRDILAKIEKVMAREESVVLSGARQTGKTSIMLMLKKTLENKGEQCWYFNLENLEHLALLNAHPFNVFQLIPDSKKRQYVFVDEIQYLDDPTNFLKLLYDERRTQLKIIASGSSSFYIDKKFKDSLVGRKFLFEVYPLNFKEFLTFTKNEEMLEKKGEISLYYQKKWHDLWNIYITYGGYPKVVLAEDVQMREIVLEDIATSYIKKDISDAGIRNVEKYFALLKILASQIGQLVNTQELANTLKVTGKTVEEYLYVMKKSYHIALVTPFFKSIRKELTKMPKVYFYDLGLRNYFLGNFDRMENRLDKGAYLENIVFREFLAQTKSADKIKFWRTQDKKEVDFIVGYEAFEIKSSEKKKNEIKKYATFTQQYPDMPLHFLTEKDTINKFYGVKI